MKTAPDARPCHAKVDDPIAYDLVDRSFTAGVRSKTLVTDAASIWTLSGWLFAAALLDLFTRRAVGWASRATSERFLVLERLRDAKMVALRIG